MRPHIWFQNGKWHCAAHRRGGAPTGTGTTPKNAYIRWAWNA